MEQLVVWFFIGLFAFYGLKLFFISNKKNKHETLLKEVPIYYNDKLGKDYIVVGTVSSEDTNKLDAEISLINQAKKLNADAIICLPVGISSHTSGGVSTSRGFDGRTKINDTTSSYTGYHYNGSAIKFTTEKQAKNTNFKSDSEKQIAQTEDQIIYEIDKQKKLLENNIIDESEYQNRINQIKNDFNKRKEELAMIKKLQEEAELNLEKQKKFLNMNLIGKKEYEKEIDNIKNKLAIQLKELGTL